MTIATERTGRSRDWALATLIAGAVGIAFAPIFVRLADVGPIASAFWRLAIAVPLLAVIAYAEPAASAPRKPSGWRDYRNLAICGLFFAADLALWHWSITLTTVANATLFANLTPIVVTVFSFLVFGQRFRRLFLIGLILAMAGVFTLMGASFEIAPERLTGDILGVATSLMYSGYLISVGRLRAEFSTQTVMLWSAAISAAALLPMALLSPGMLVPAGLSGWLVLAGLALIAHVTGQGLIAFSLAHLPAAFGAISLLVQPVVAALIAWYLFGEALGVRELLGAALILSGILMARLGIASRRPPGAPR